MLNALLRTLSYHPKTRWMFKDLRLSGSRQRKKLKFVKLPTQEPLAKKDSTATKNLEIILKGVLEPGTSHEYRVNGFDFRRDSGTWIVGEGDHGVPVVVNASRRADGSLYAKKIMFETAEEALGRRQRIEG